MNNCVLCCKDVSQCYKKIKFLTQLLKKSHQKHFKIMISLRKRRIRSTKRYGKPYERFILDPFQIFCMENRKSLQEQFPEMKSSEITAFLGEKWRSLNESEKTNYKNLAFSLINNKCLIQRTPKTHGRRNNLYTIVKTKEKINNAGQIRTPNPNKIKENQLLGLYIPKLFIVPRIGVDNHTSNLSIEILKNQLVKASY